MSSLKDYIRQIHTEKVIADKDEKVPDWMNEESSDSGEQSSKGDAPSEPSASEPSGDNVDVSKSEEISAGPSEPSPDSKVEKKPTASKKGDNQSADSRKWKVKTSLGEQEVSEKELLAGYMRQADYTRHRQESKPKEKLVEELISNPVKLVEFATKHGVDINRFINTNQNPQTQAKVEPEEETPEFSTDIEKKLWEMNKKQSEMIKSLSGEINQLKGGFGQVQEKFQRDEHYNRYAQLRQEFNEANAITDENGKVVRAKLPESVFPLVPMMLELGMHTFGTDNITGEPTYKVRHAVKDLVDMMTNSGSNDPADIIKNNPQLRDMVINEYNANLQKKKEKFPGVASGGNSIATNNQPQKPKNLKEARTFLKTMFGVKEE